MTCCSFLLWFTGWCCRTPLRCALSCTTPLETCARTFPHSPLTAAWSKHSGDRFYPARQPKEQRCGSLRKKNKKKRIVFKLAIFLLTSWFSWNNTRYSERCCRINFLMTSCLMRGSNTLATRQASRSTLLGPTDLWKQTELFKVRHWFEAHAKTLQVKSMMTLDPWEGKASSKSANIWVPNSLWAAFTLEKVRKIHFYHIYFCLCCLSSSEDWHSVMHPH